MALTFLKIGHFHPDFAQWQSSPGVTGLLILLSPGEIPYQPGPRAARAICTTMVPPVIDLNALWHTWKQRENCTHFWREWELTRKNPFFWAFLTQNTAKLS